MTVCPKCFAEIPDASVFCLECGARIREDTTDTLYAEGSDREVYPEIARANLLRMQGKYEEAIDVCLGILRRFPSNETAHALMGDIYADQGKLEDAIQWYELLVDLAPNNAVYSAKLMNLRAMHTATIAPPPPIQIPEAPAKAPSAKRWTYALLSLLVLVLVASAFIAGFRMSTTREQGVQASTLSASKPSGDSSSLNSPQIPPPPPTASGSTRPYAGEPSPPDTPVASNVSPFTGMSDLEERLARALSQRLNGLPIWCHYDIITQRWSVRARLQGGVITRSRVMQEALAVASAFYEKASQVRTVSVTIFVPHQSGADQPLFTAEVSRAMVSQPIAQLSEEQLNALFQQTPHWWNETVSLST